MLDDPEHYGKISGDAQKLWQHHAIEEYEHRKVSFDVLTRVGGSFSEEVRELLFVPVSIVFAAVVAHLYVHNLRKQKVSLKELTSVVPLFILLSKNLPKLKDWFSTDFHPEMHETQNADFWKRKLNLA